jgi:hypothetical protein
MIEETNQQAFGAGASPTNIIPSSFNPVPADGVLEVWACLDPLGSPSAANKAPTLSVTLGGATPTTPVQPTAIQTNPFGVIGGAPTEANRICSPQAVEKGTNSQLIAVGGSTDYTGYVKVRFRTLQELQSGLGS